MARFAGRLVPVLVAAWLLAAADSAEAKLPLLFTHGDSIKHLGDVPQNMQADLQRMTGANSVPRIGYFHGQFGVFWLDLWTWGGKYCLYADNTYWELEPAQAALLLGVSENQLARPFFYRFPPGLLILCGLGIVVGISSWRTKRQQRALAERVQGLLDDSRYKRALEIIEEHHKRRAAQAEQAAAEKPADAPPDRMALPATPAADDDGGFGAAVQHLVDNGIDRPEAEQNLGLLLHTLLAASQAA